MVTLYQPEKQHEKKWGKSVVEVLAKELKQDFPGVKGFSVGNLWRVRKIYVSYSKKENLAPLVREINWSKNIVIMGKCNFFKPNIGRNYPCYDNVGNFFDFLPTLS